MDRVRDAMIAEPRSLPATATAQEAGVVLTPAEVRAVFVVDEGGTLVGVVTRKTLVARVVAPGLDPRTTPLADGRRGAALHDRARRAASRRRSTSSRSAVPSACPSSRRAA